MVATACRRLVRGLLACLSLLLLPTCGGRKSASPPVADFSLQVTPGNVAIPAGGSAFVTVTLTRLNGFDAAVALSGTGFPAGVVASGTIPMGSSTLQLPVAVDPAVLATAYSGLAIRASSGTLVHDTAFGLTVAPALPPSSLRVDGVQAAGVRQTGGDFVNVGVGQEPIPATTVKDANDTIRVRHGFDPTGTPVNQ